MKTMIIAGNKNYGLGKHLYKEYSDATFYSRSCGGYDLCDRCQRQNFIEKSLSYDVFISCSYLPDYNQLFLVRDLWKYWNKKKKKGSIIVIGSTADNKNNSSYSLEKKSLKTFCRNYGNGFEIKNETGLFETHGIKITYISPGLLDVGEQKEKYLKINKIGPDYLVKTITWLLNQPEDILIHNLTIGAITL